MEHILDMLVINLIQVVNFGAGNIPALAVITTYIINIFLLLTYAYIVAYEIDELSYYKVRKIMKLRHLRFLFKQFGKVMPDEIAVSTFFHEMIVIFMITLSLCSMLISIFLSDVLKIILFIIIFTATIFLLGYLVRIEYKIKREI